MAYFWSKKEIQVLIERVNDNCDWPEVSRHLPFTPSECKRKFEELKAKVSLSLSSSLFSSFFFYVLYVKSSLRFSLEKRKRTLLYGA